MDSTVRTVLAVFMRWIHIASVVTLLGGFIYARYALAPTLATLPEPEQKTLGLRVIANFRPLMYTVLVTILGSGLYNYLTKPSYPPHYHMIIGIKFLFVLHIFAVSILYSLPGAEQAKRNRWLTGMVVSGLIIIAISGYLRWISLA
ncbi:MAG TPA: hypothetical protein VKX49_17670 [Bryobacteraceae bacterium]|nr:hypothetical protein [Bryobacteraceae bacterium]